MSEKVTIEPQYILDFVGDLGVHAYAEYSGKDPAKKLGKKEVKELRATAATVSTEIAKGLILAKHQPELANALVEQMNRGRPGYADELLSHMLLQYQFYLCYKHFVEEAGGAQMTDISRQLESFCRDYITALGQALDVAIRVNRKEYEAGFNSAMDLLSKGPVGLSLHGRNPFQFGVLKEDRPRILAEIKLLAEAGGIPYNKMSPLNQFIVTIQPYVYYCLEKYLPNDAGLREEAKHLMNTRGFIRYLQEDLGYPISQTIGGAFRRPKVLGYLARLFDSGRND